MSTLSPPTNLHHCPRRQTVACARCMPARTAWQHATASTGRYQLGALQSKKDPKISLENVFQVYVIKSC